MKLATHLFTESAARRHGVVLPPVTVPVTPADVPGLVNVAVPSVVDTEASPAAGGIGRDELTATYSAIGEALERYAGSLAPIQMIPRGQIPSGEAALDLGAFSLFDKEQQKRTDFPYRTLYDNPRLFTDAYDLVTNARTWVPAALMTLDRGRDGIATSSGMAANPDKGVALLRALQELIERDALMTVWMHELPGKRIALDAKYTDPIAGRNGAVVAIDATPAYSAHPVAIVMGNVPRRGVPRLSLGAACRGTWDEAVDKAYLEWAQGITFIGDRQLRDPHRTFANADEVRDFDHHALYYSTKPLQWDDLPIFKGYAGTAPVDAPGGTPMEQLEALAKQVVNAGFHLYYRDLTTLDLQQIGMHAVRVLSPDLVPVHHDHRFPHLGGTAKEAARRYPGAVSGRFPSPNPHPLG